LKKYRVDKYWIMHVARVAARNLKELYEVGMDKLSRVDDKDVLRYAAWIV